MIKTLSLLSISSIVGLFSQILLLPSFCSFGADRMQTIFLEDNSLQHVTAHASFRICIVSLRSGTLGAKTLSPLWQMGFYGFESSGANLCKYGLSFVMTSWSLKSIWPQTCHVVLEVTVSWWSCGDSWDTQYRDERSESFHYNNRFRILLCFWEFGWDTFTPLSIRL